jgi:hypothetical protein
VITLIIEVQTLPGKRLEFLRTLEGYDNLPGLMKKIRDEISCIRCHYLIKQKNKFNINVEFNKLEEVKELLRSECFTVLQGAINVLCKTPEVKITNASNIAGVAGIEETLKKKYQSRSAPES